jgi:hypothetical protein
MSKKSSIDEYLILEDWDNWDKYLEEDLEEDFLYNDEIPELLEGEDEKRSIGNFFSLMFAIIGGLFFFLLISVEILQSYRTDWWITLSWTFLGMFCGAIIGFVVDSLLFVLNRREHKTSLS